MKSKAEEKFLQLLRQPVKNREEMIEMEKASKEFAAELRLETGDLIAELDSVGVAITSIYDLVNTSKSYPAAIPILISHLSRKYHDKNKEGIIRALAVKEARGLASPALIAEYNRIPKDKMNLRWVIGNTVNMTFTESDVESILPIVQNKENGYSRGQFIVALGRAKSDRVEDVLIKLLDDEVEVARFAIMALGKMKSLKAKEKITHFLQSPNKHAKKEAIKALKRIENKKAIKLSQR